MDDNFRVHLKWCPSASRRFPLYFRPDPGRGPVRAFIELNLGTGSVDAAHSWQHGFEHAGYRKVRFTVNPLMKSHEVLGLIIDHFSFFRELCRLHSRYNLSQVDQDNYTSALLDLGYRLDIASDPEEKRNIIDNIHDLRRWIEEDPLPFCGAAVARYIKQLSIKDGEDGFYLGNGCMHEEWLHPLLIKIWRTMFQEGRPCPTELVGYLLERKPELLSGTWRRLYDAYRKASDVGQATLSIDSL